MIFHNETCFRNVKAQTRFNKYVMYIELIHSRLMDFVTLEICRPKLDRDNEGTNNSFFAKSMTLDMTFRIIDCKLMLFEILPKQIIHE